MITLDHVGLAVADYARSKAKQEGLTNITAELGAVRPVQRRAA